MSRSSAFFVCSCAIVATYGWTDVLLFGPANHNVFLPFFYTKHATKQIQDICHEEAESLRECCLAPPETCFGSAIGIAVDMNMPTHFQCCWDLVHGQGIPTVYFVNSPGELTGTRVMEMSPRVPEALCLIRATERLVNVYLDFTQCTRSLGSGAKPGRTRSRGGRGPSSEGSPLEGVRTCLTAAVKRQEALGSSGRVQEAGDSCWFGPLGAEDGWKDVWAALRLLALQPCGPRLAAELEDTLELVNAYIWQVGFLLASNRGTGPPGPPARFRLAVTAPLGSALPVQGPLAGAHGPHRGDVLLRLLRGLAVARRRSSDETAAAGLVMVELGTGKGDLAQWLAVHARSLLKVLHVVDNFVQYEGQGLDEDRFARVMDGLLAQGLVPAAPPPRQDASTAAEAVGASAAQAPGGALLRWPAVATRAVTAGESLEVRVHASDTSAAASAAAAPSASGNGGAGPAGPGPGPIFADESEQVDLVFVDAGHAYEEVLADIRAWWPRIRPGGCMVGHDFRRLDSAYWQVGGVPEAVSHAFAGHDVFLDSETVWWTMK
eukprot:TRINITY_DN4458_c0_g3_i1.p1 TRINITY_DN4458_c0_g3~~TRINITY_DN4458_c0_g3_i1.p1  ORF type:complete len:548 (-),score=95.84 TRINITY_DN4458_c0_g3_i1:68-1711(-)